MQIWDSYACEAALHDGRISLKNTSIELNIHLFRNKIPNYPSLRNGIKSKGYNGHTTHFYFISGRIIENILDIATLHRNFIGSEDSLINGEIECFVESTILNDDVIFKTFPQGDTIKGQWNGVSNYRRYVLRQINKAYPAVSCTTKNYILSRAVTFPILTNSGAATPFLTRTCNINDENLEISLKNPQNKIWYKDDFNLNDISGSNTLGRTYERHTEKLIVKNVELYHDGIYHFHEVGHSVATRLIVRVCRKNQYGPNCEHDCLQCLNGGICHDITGICICPPGYNGSLCTEVCPRNRFGRSCSFKCDENDTPDGCKGLLICLPDPFGCTCGLGFGGLDCTADCIDGFYGSGCKEKCGPCALNVMCNKITGICPEGCQAGKKDSFCKIDRPLLLEAPTDCNITQYSICIKWKPWNESTDIGTGMVKAYLIKYNKVDSENVEQVLVGLTPEMSFRYNISGLDHSTTYEISIGIEDEIGVVDIVYSPSIKITTKCKEPSKGPDNLQIQNYEQDNKYYMRISWNERNDVSGICQKNTSYEIIITNKGGDILLERNTNETHVIVEIDKQFICTQFKLKIRFIFEDKHSNWTEIKKYWYTLPVRDLIFEEWNQSFKFSWENVSLKKECKFSYEIELTYLKSSHCIDDVTQHIKFRITRNTTITIKYLKPSSIYKVNISTVNNSSRSVFTTNITTSGNKPSGQPQNVIQTIENITTAIFKWSPPNCIDINGNITNYSLILNQNGINQTFVHTLLTNLEMTFFNLIPNSTYIVYIFATNDNGTGPPYISRFSNYPPTKAQSSNILNDILLAVGICLLIVLIIISVIILYRKQKRKRLLKPSYSSNDICLQERDNASSELLNSDFTAATANLRNADDILVKDLMAYSNEMKICNGFVMKYSNVQPTGQYASWEVAKRPQNKIKNRYGNIIAYDHSRVALPLLDIDENSDYINANYIHGYKEEKSYIATQGPTEATFIDFWRMVWLENIEKIIMLCELIEAGKIKCDQYWPRDYFQVYGEISVSLLKTEVFTNYTIRTMVIKKISDVNEREIWQFHFTSWPDHGVPLNATALISFYKKTNLIHHQDKNPILVHCSAGVGRTGTFILMDILVKQARAQNLVNIDYYLSHIRQDRINMIQTIEQYIFLHDALIEALQARDTNYYCQDFIMKFDNKIRSKSKESQIHLPEQFNVLEDMKPIINIKDLSAGNLEENRNRNRDPDIIPPNYARPYLMTFNGEKRNNYINGVYINAYRKKNAFIVTQMPLPQQFDDFWRMIYDHKSCCIVMLNEINDSTFIPYWPKTGYQLYDMFKVEHEKSESEDEIIIQTFKISNTLMADEPPKKVKQFYIQNFEEQSFVSVSTETLIKLSDMVERWQQKTENQPITIHCLNGVNCSGLFCAFLNIRERILTEQEVDIFMDVKHIRSNRPQFIVSLDQYMLLHEVTVAFINSFEMYANLK